MVLYAIDSSHQFCFSAAEGYALRYFTGYYRITHVQQLCQQHYGDQISAQHVVELVQKLIEFGLLASATPPTPQVQLKAVVHWIQHPDGYWILRNPEDVTFLQVSERDKHCIEQLQQYSLETVAQAYQISVSDLQYLLRLLRVTGMIAGTQPPQPSRGKFTPLHLTFFKLRLFNPDPWLNHWVTRLGWIWTQSFFVLLIMVLLATVVMGLHERAELQLTAQLLLSHKTPSTALAFIGLSAIVITLHELGHALTLKHYRGIVPEMGLMFMLLVPVAYTNTSDQYSLPSRRQRALVVAAGVLCQLAIASLAFWVWNSAARGSWLSSASFLLLVAALLTVAVNLNPLARFDGYYLSVALSGINNVRRRSFQFYRDLFSGRQTKEQGQTQWVLAAYAPFSFLYLLTVFGFLLLRLGDWTLTHLPLTALVVLALWAVYFFTPTTNVK